MQQRYGHLHTDNNRAPSEREQIDMAAHERAISAVKPKPDPAWPANMAKPERHTADDIH